MVELWQTVLQLVAVLSKLVVEILSLGLQNALLLAWLAYAMFGVNWKKTWAVLSAGAWIPALVSLVMAALVWSQLAPSECTCLGFMTVANFWWQLGAVGLIASLTLFCGWLQGLMHWTPAEISLEPPAPAHDGHHDHGHHH